MTLWCEFEQDLMTNMDLTLEAGKVENIFEFLTLCTCEVFSTQFAPFDFQNNLKKEKNLITGLKS